MKRKTNSAVPQKDSAYCLKKLLRRQCKALTAALTEEDRDAQSRAICAEIRRMIESRPGCRKILLYWSLADEPRTHSLIPALHKEGYEVFLPVITGADEPDGGQIRLRAFRGLENMTVGAFNIQEPLPELKEPGMSETDIDIAFIPGVAFSREGHRLGRGKGYYDRFLKKVSCPVYGVCFPCQIVEAVPMEDHDVPLTGILSL